MDGDEIVAELKSDAKDAPHLRVFFNPDHSVKAVFIVGNGTFLKCHPTIKGSLKVLMALYYVFNMEYPTCYGLALGVLQNFCLPELPFSLRRTKAFSLFVTQVKKAIAFDNDDIMEESDKENKDKNKETDNFIKL